MPKEFKSTPPTTNATITNQDDKIDKSESKNEDIEASLYFDDACDSKSDNSGSNWTENPAYCAPKRKVKVNVAVQESPRTVRRKKYKIHVKNDSDENVTEKEPNNNVQKGGEW